MHLIGLIVIIYVILAEWRIAKLKKTLGQLHGKSCKNTKGQDVVVFGCFAESGRALLVSG